MVRYSVQFTSLTFLGLSLESMFAFPPGRGAGVLLVRRSRGAGERGSRGAEEQKQHLELTRDIAARFNHQFGNGQKVLKLPDPLIRAEGARVMSLTDGTRKMSKSDPSDQSRISLLDTPDQIQNKIKRCKTDATRGLWFDDPQRPESNNLLTLYMLLSGKTKEEVAAECKEMGWGQFKPLLTETTINALKPIQDKYHAVMNDKGYLESVLRDGREKAEAMANQTLADVKAALGYSVPL